MKSKKVLLAGAACGLLFLTGCGNGNKLVCKINMDSYLQNLGTMDAEVEVAYDSDGKKPTGVEFELVAKITSDQIKESDMPKMKDQLEDSFCDNDSFKNCNVKVSGKKITISAEADAAKFLESSSDEDSKTKEEAKEYLESQGFKCE